MTNVSPCLKESSSSFDSGFMPANASSQPTVTFTLDAQSASAPQWFYCKQKNPVSHCHKGMIFALNPSPSKTFGQFKQNAINDATNPAPSGTPCTTSGAPNATAPPSSGGGTTSTGTNYGGSGTTSYGGSGSGNSTGSTGYGGSAGSSTSNGTVHSILVGENNTLTFNPPSIQAVAGDTVLFNFLSKNHSVTQSTFTSPCTLAPGGVDSGFQATSPNSTTTMQWSITLDAKSASGPLWFFCAQTKPAVHCHTGMVFAINANAQKSFDQYKLNAMNSNDSSSSPSTSSSPSSPTSDWSPAGKTPGGNTASTPAAAPANVNSASNGVPGFRSSLNTVVLTVIVGLVASFSF